MPERVQAGWPGEFIVEAIVTVAEAEFALAALAMSELGIKSTRDWVEVPGNGVENGLRAVTGRGLGASE